MALIGVSGGTGIQVEEHHELPSFDAHVPVPEGVVEVSCPSVARRHPEAHLMSTAFAHEVVERVHHLATQTLIAIAVTDSDAECRDTVALVPTAKHPVRDRDPVEEAHDVGILADVCGHRARAIRPQVVGPEPRRVEPCEEDLQHASVARANAADAQGVPGLRRSAWRPVLDVHHPPM